MGTETSKPKTQKDLSPKAQKPLSPVTPKKEERTTTLSKMITSTSSGHISRSSIYASKQVAASLAEKLMGYDIDRQDVDSTMTSLREYKDCPIVAVWLCTRPILNVAGGRFHHWCVKMHAGDILLEMDFFEKDKKGAFGLTAKTTMFTELDEFLKYYIASSENQWDQKQYTILACALPTLPLSDEDNNSERIYRMPELISQYLEEFEDSGKTNGYVPAKFKEMNVAKIINFLQEWTAKYTKYNALSCNCQTFAKDLYEFIIGNHYKHQLGGIINQMQSFVDFDREWKKLEDEHQQNAKETNVKVETTVEMK